MTSLALKEARDAAVAKLTELAKLAEERSLTEDEVKAFDAAEKEVADIDKRWDASERAHELAGQSREPRQATPDLDAAARPAEGRNGGLGSPAVHTRDHETYKKGGRRSWFQDMKAANVDRSSEARKRMSEFAKFEAEKDEERALNSTDGTGGYLVAPLYLQNEFVELRTYNAVAASLVTNLPLPADTDLINIPTMATGTAVAKTTENSELTETSFTDDSISATVYRVGGLQTIPNTLMDRSVPGIDQIVIRDLAKRLAIQQDTWVLHGTGSSQPYGITKTSGITTRVYTDASPTFAELWPYFLGAVADVRAGAKEEPSDILMHPRRASWLMGQVDSNGRPFIPSLVGYGPQNANGLGIGSVEGRMALSLAGFSVSLDGNVTTTYGSSTNEDQIIVGAFKEAYLFNGTPKFAVSTDNKFTYDSTVVRCTQDMAFTAGRVPAAFTLITGTGLTPTL